MKEIIKFLELNGYTEGPPNFGFRRFFKEHLSPIYISEAEIFLNGDWLHLPVNIYALLGALIHRNELSIDYKFPERV